jgi:hypothetical protein
VYLITPLHSTLTLTLTTLATPLLVLSTVSIRSTSILMLQTTVLFSTTLLVIRVLHLMTLVYSTAHTFLFRWFVQLDRTPSNPRLALRPATAWSLTHSQKEPIRRSALSRLPPTATTVAFPSRTLCDPSGYTTTWTLRGPFFMPRYKLVGNNFHYINYVKLAYADYIIQY